MKFLKENKNYIKAIALALVILMCTPFLTLNAIETMSGGGSSREVTTGETTKPPETYDNFEDMYRKVVGDTMVSAPVNDGQNWMVVQGSGLYLRYNYSSGFGWYERNGIRTYVFF